MFSRLAIILLVVDVGVGSGNVSLMPCNLFFVVVAAKLLPLAWSPDGFVVLALCLRVEKSIGEIVLVEIVVLVSDDASLASMAVAVGEPAGSIRVLRGSATTLRANGKRKSAIFIAAVEYNANLTSDLNLNCKSKYREI